MKQIFRLVGIAMILALFSCSKGETALTREIDNQTNYQMTVTFDHNLTGENRAVDISAHERKVIYWSSSDKENDLSSDCLNELKNIQLNLESGLTLIKDITQSENWTNYQELSGMSEQNTRQICTFTVTEEDIQ